MRVVTKLFRFPGSVSLQLYRRASGVPTSRKLYEDVKDYYGKVLQSSKDLKTSACCTPGSLPGPIRDCLKVVPQEITDRYYGCGTPIPLGIEGKDLLDLGSGSGRDCYIAAKLVGPNGSAMGVDMTDEQLEVARKHVHSYCVDKLGYKKPNLSFVKGYIEFLQEAGVADESKDIVISNCVVNLSPNKEQVIKSVYRALRMGGEFYFSDVYCDRRLPENVRTDKVLVGECLGGTLYLEDFMRICAKVGFVDPRVVSRSPVSVTDPALKQVLGHARFESITFRLFKLPALETKCEDYGQAAVYLGTIPGHPHDYPLDDHHNFVTKKAMLVCGNTASMVGESWLAPHFRIYGDTSTHLGLFDCAPASCAPPSPTTSVGSGSCC